MAFSNSLCSSAAGCGLSDLREFLSWQHLRHVFHSLLKLPCAICQVDLVEERDRLIHLNNRLSEAAGAALLRKGRSFAHVSVASDVGGQLLGDLLAAGASVCQPDTISHQHPPWWLTSLHCMLITQLDNVSGLSMHTAALRQATLCPGDGSGQRQRHQHSMAEGFLLSRWSA